MVRKIVTILLALVLLSGVMAVPAQAATPAQIEASILKGLAWLADMQGGPGPGNGNGSWQFGSWGPFPEHDTATTALAVLKFEDRAKELGLDPLDTTRYQYAQNVIDGLKYIFGNATLDGNGVHFGNFFLDVYNTGISMMAIAASQHPGDMIVGGALNGMTYSAALSGMMQWLAFAQTTTPPNTGGWPYNPGGTPGWGDNSISGYATIGIGYANSPPPTGFSLPIPASVLTGLSTFITSVQVNGGAFDGGSIYQPSWGMSMVNTLKTGNLLYELALVGAPVGDSRVQRAITFIANYWNAPGGQSNGDGWIGDYQAMFTMMKGLQAYGITTIAGVGDWFDLVSTNIVNAQYPDGHWLSTTGEVTSSATISTAFALLTLEKVVPPPPAREGRMTGGGSVLMKDGSRVTHGFELHCDVNKSPNRLEVNWGKGNKFHLEKLVSASCSDDPNITPNPPPAGFDTYDGKGTGRYNGVAGAKAEWTFTDAGEPGKNDTAAIKIWDAGGNLVLSVSGNLQNGNHQAHKK